LLLVSFSVIPANALDADTATIRVRVISPAIVTSPVHLEIKAADDPEFLRTAELIDLRDAALFRQLLAGTYHLTAALSGFRDAEAVFSLAPAAIAEVIVDFCDPAAACIASTTRVVDSDAFGHGYSFDRSALETFPSDDASASIVETSVAQIVVDRISSGGLWAGEAALIGGSGASWRQTSIRLGGVDLTDPVRTGTPLIRSDPEALESLLVHTAMLPPSVGGPGPVLTLLPKMPSNAWHGGISFATAPAALQSSNAQPAAPSIARFANHREWGAQIQGRLLRRGGLFLSTRQVVTDRIERDDPALLRTGVHSFFANSALNTGDTGRLRMSATVDRVTVPYPGRARFPNRMTSENDTFTTAHATWDHWTARGGGWSASSAFARGTLAPVLDVAPSSDAHIAGAVVDRLRDGPVPSLFEVFPSTRRKFVGRIDVEPAWPRRRHSLAIGASLTRSSAATRFTASSPVAEMVDGIPARLWEYGSSGPPSHWMSTTAAGYVNDRLFLPRRIRVDAGARAELTRGSSRGGSAIEWPSLAPRLSVHWIVDSEQRLEVFGGRARYMHNLPLDYLSFGDPSALTGRVYRWDDADHDGAFDVDERGVLVAAVGACCANGIPNRIDSNLRQPHTDELVAGIVARAGRWSLRLTGVERHERQLIASVNIGVTEDDYLFTYVSDVGERYVEPQDDRLLLVYDRKPSSFGQDQYVLTNPQGHTGYYKGFEVTLEGHIADIARTRFDGSAYHGATLGANRGFGAAENDPGVIGELFENPNATTYARGHAFSDRGYAMKLWGQYLAPKRYVISAAARYQDGQSFSRLVVVPGLNQGPEAISAYRRGRTRFTFTFSLDTRVQKSFRVGKAYVTGMLTLFNALNTGEEVEENVVTSASFRIPTLMQPPRTAHIGMRIEF